VTEDSRARTEPQHQKHDENKNLDRNVWGDADERPGFEINYTVKNEKRKMMMMKRRQQGRLEEEKREENPYARQMQTKET
jgi:hypothetical protein